MTKFTIEDLRDIAYCGSYDDLERELALQLLASMEQEPVAYMHHSGQVVTREECCDDEIFAICCKVETPLYAAPQLPQPAVPDMAAVGEMPFLGTQEKAFVSGWNACRAAMLQGAEPASNCDELPLDYLQGHKDGLEWAAQLAKANHPETGDWLYDDPIELSKAIRKGPDMPLSDGNSPVIQDGWIKCSERMPEDEQEVLTRNRMGHCFVSFFDEHSGLFFDRVDVAAACCIEHILVTHWMPLPAAPQQEVKSALEHGMQRYAGAMQKLVDSGD
ncbi:DUF551 domain-containing protein [Citrobacter freundii]|uniref:DUF551 domain-containing protein n=1 Tax=Citrobacter freundii TaxID=546 RepID=UPI001D1F2284|nr:DUF551 domain-containing protein [Citrobacter freundii]MDU2466989.1 DUF551 domain-containing protein [Veillonella sp.]MDT7333592.1 DUF551 domain-containing protein [Citrobacter freundii]CAE7405799.1 hypothetical protein AI2666V1_2086 [Citrobacter freundii]CAE7408785.1 hypothetical protein AI2668V1_2083 [Citrobacter freundii]CAH3669299.1 hypothetical protein AI2668V1_2083 [Citrobacter freundii]